MFSNYLQQTFLLVIVLSGIPLLAASALGLFVGFLQAATQIQEQSISFVIKSAGVALVLSLLGSWYGHELASFSQRMFSSLEFLGKL